MKNIYEKIIRKMPAVAARNADKIPYTACGHIFDDRTEDINWWTNGFWGGIMWQMYSVTGSDIYADIAEKVGDRLDRNLVDAQGMDHDSGFRYLPTAVADYRITGSAKAKNRGLLAAANLAGRFNPAGHFIRAWNDSGDGSTAGWAIIDCMMNLPLLYWAYEETGDPRFLETATAHADTAVKYFIREDGSVRHIVEFDPVSGKFVKEHGGQGYAAGSSWTRGQGWALYGFALSYCHTGKKMYLDTAERVADRFCKRIPASGRIPADFDQPEECTYTDDTASAIAACGLAVLSENTSDGRRDFYMNTAERLLKVLDESSCDWDIQHDEILSGCTAAYYDEKHNFPIIYGDYFFMEAVFRLTGHGISIW